MVKKALEFNDMSVGRCTCLAPIMLCLLVAENLYRLESSGGYYALVKKAGKQFRRSLKTNDRKLAERRLGDRGRTLYFSSGNRFQMVSLPHRWRAHKSLGKNRAAHGSGGFQIPFYGWNGR